MSALTEQDVPIAQQPTDDQSHGQYLAEAISAIEATRRQQVTVLHDLCEAWKAQNPGVEPLPICRKLAAVEALLAEVDMSAALDLPGLLDLPVPIPLHGTSGSGNMGVSSKETLGKSEGSTAPISQLHSISSAARLIGITPAAIRHWIKKGYLKATKANDRYYITEDDLTAANRRMQTIAQGRPRSATSGA